MNRFSDIDLNNKRLPPVGGYWNENIVSLEEALEPSPSPRLNELNRSIKTAKKYCTFPSEHGLTRDESAAVYLYTMEGGQNSFYKVLNEALRSENRPALKPWFPFLKLFDVAVNKLPTIKGNIWRGVPGHISGQFTKGQVLTWWSISSCSQSMDIIQSFLGSGINSTLFMIEAVNGKDVSAYSYYPNENEVLLTLGTELQVKSNTLKHHGGLSIVHLVELGDDDVEQLPKAIAKMDLKPKVSVEGATGKY
jgi:hypothetical protein